MAFNFLGNLLTALYQAQIPLQDSGEQDTQCISSENTLVIIIVLIMYRGGQGSQVNKSKMSKPTVKAMNC